MKAVGDASLKARFATAFLDQPGNIGNAGSVALGHYVAHTFNVELAKGDFVERYQKFSGHVPSYIEPQAVNALRMMLTAAQIVDSGGGKIDATKIAEAMEKTSLPTDIGTITFRKEDHQALLPVVAPRPHCNLSYSNPWPKAREVGEETGRPGRPLYLAGRTPATITTSRTAQKSTACVIDRATIFSSPPAPPVHL